MTTRWTRPTVARRGVAAVEYILVVALVALAVAAVFMVFPEALADFYEHVTGMICQA